MLRPRRRNPVSTAYEQNSLQFSFMCLRQQDLKHTITIHQLQFSTQHVL